MNRFCIWFGFVWLCCGPAAGAGEAENAGAVRKGVRWLREEVRRKPADSSRFLAAYALVHAGVNREEDDGFDRWLNGLLREEPKETYDVSLKILLMHRLGAQAHQEGIARLAQRLVDSQREDGTWGYAVWPLREGCAVREAGRGEWYPVYDGETVVGKQFPSVQIRPSPRRRSGRGGQRDGERNGEDEEQGDFSNTQYAVLGLRAAEESGCRIPGGVWKRTFAHFDGAQNKDGGYGYREGRTSTRSMTAAGASVLAICRFYTGKEPGRSSSEKKAAAFLTDRWSVVPASERAPVLALLLSVWTGAGRGSSSDRPVRRS